MQRYYLPFPIDVHARGRHAISLRILNKSMTETRSVCYGCPDGAVASILPAIDLYIIEGGTLKAGLVVKGTSQAPVPHCNVSSANNISIK